jgi:VWFA-related protein
VKVRLMGGLVKHVITGDRGIAAVIRYSDEPQVLANFSRDAKQLEAAFNRLNYNGTQGRLLDTVVRAVKMFNQAPPNCRRVILIFGERKDRGSETTLSDALTLAQRENVTVYAVSYSPTVTQLIAKPADLPQSGAMDLTALFKHLGKASQVDALGELARQTGGREVSFVRQEALEQQLTAIGEELHSQYLLSFVPPRETRAEYHRLDVRVVSRADAVVRARPGYWLAKPE